MTRYGLDDPRPHILWQSTFTPTDFEMTHLALGGSLYGYASHSPMSAFKRPDMISPMPGMVFAGGTTHPGGGIPLVVLSGQMAAREVLRHLGCPDISIAAAKRD
jgi:phytoene desaturase